MPPLDDLTVLVTGATDGLGRACAIDLAGQGARVLVHGRDDARGRATLDEIRATTGNDRLHWYKADLSSLDEVRRLADEAGRDHDRLDVLLSNAGIGATVPGGGARQVSADGHELRFAVNYLAGFLLSGLLWPLLSRSAPARVIHVSSAGQEPIDFGDVMLTRGYSGVRAYCQSKLAQVLLGFDQAEAYPGSGIAVASLHPATYMPTKIVPSPISTVADGVEATDRLVAEVPAEEMNGRWYNPTRAARADAQAYDAGARRRLRELSEELTGITAPW